MHWIHKLVLVSAIAGVAAGVSACAPTAESTATPPVTVVVREWPPPAPTAAWGDFGILTRPGASTPITSVPAGGSASPAGSATPAATETPTPTPTVAATAAAK